MIVRASTALLAAAIGVAGLFSPAISQAAVVGHLTKCTYFNSGNTAAMIAQAGHTPVAIASVNAESLAGLDALVYEECALGEYATGAAVDAAVADGMVLVTHPWPWQPTMTLPGNVRPTLTPQAGKFMMVLPVGSPALTGPGGTLTANFSYYSTPQSFFLKNTIPLGSEIIATSNLSTNEVVAFAYQYGRGKVVVSTVSLNFFLLGGAGEFYAEAPPIRAYASNLVAWAVGPSFTSCAAEGYSGSRLTMCRQICEVDQTPARLSAWIKLYTAAYREDPPCAR